MEFNFKMLFSTERFYNLFYVKKILPTMLLINYVFVSNIKKCKQFDCNKEKCIF